MKVRFQSLALFFICMQSVYAYTGSENQRLIECVAGILKTIDENNFNHQRPYHAHEYCFGPDFKSILERLRVPSHWVDFGAGDGWAQLSYEVDNPSHAAIPNMIAISVKRPPVNETIYNYMEKPLGSQFRFLEGRFVEDIPTNEIPPVDLGTDLYGPASYTLRLSELFNKYFSVLKPKSGTLFVGLVPEKTMIRTAKGNLTLDQWLETLPGVHIQKMPHPETGDLGLKIQIDSNAVRVPHVKLVGATDDIPPFRQFEEY
jgi:hypothetical protein